MAASFNDEYWLSQDPGFQHRVQSSFLAACTAISNEGFGIAFHRERQRYITQSLSSPQALSNAIILISAAVATDPNVIADATVGGTIAITSLAIAATQSVAVSDAHIGSAISAQFNMYSMQPDN